MVQLASHRSLSFSYTLNQGVSVCSASRENDDECSLAIGVIQENKSWGNLFYFFFFFFYVKEIIMQRFKKKVLPDVKVLY